MMKEVCAQCLQRQIDPQTGKEIVVFSCFNQDQPQDTVDWGHLAERLRQNTVQEKLSDSVDPAPDRMSDRMNSGTSV